MGCVGSRTLHDETESNSKVTKLDNLDQLKGHNGNNNKLTMPDPRPPKKRKKDILPDVSSLKHIDDHVLKTPGSAESSIEALGEYLTRIASNDLEKVRAFYKWVTENIRYDTDTYFGRTNGNTASNPASVLSSKSSVCEGYASFFQLLCNYAGIPVKKISGHAKGFSYKPGFNFTKDTATNHAWNAVYIDGDWRFIETTWGAGILGDNNQFVKDFNDFYFLTDPELFVVDHFPYFDKDEIQSSKWQLLKKPISLNTFNKRIKPSRHAREWGVTFPSDLQSIIEVEKTVDIIFHAKSSVLDHVNVKLFDSQGANNDQYTAVKKESRKFTVTVCPKTTGEYKLEIYGTIDADADSLHCLIVLAVKCKSVAKEHYPLPKFHGFYGPVENWKERGFKNIDKIPVSVTSKTGEISLSLNIKEETNVMATLKNSDDVKLVQYTMVELDKQLNVKARLPEKGYYRLMIYSQFQSQSYTPAINILVHNLKEPPCKGPYPQTYPETITFKCVLLEPLTQDLPANSEVRFRFSSPLMTEASLMREPVAKKTRNTWDTTVKTPPYGEVRISGKKEKVATSYVVYSFKVK